jgi:hypothetical protein
LAGLGFFVKEMNAGWQEWSTEALPVHEGRVAKDTMRCTCSRVP